MAQDNYMGGINDTALLREFLDRHGSPAVILACPPTVADSTNFPRSPTADLECLIRPTDDINSLRSPTTASYSPPSVLGPAQGPSLIYYNPSFSAWIRAADFPEKSFQDWAEDFSVWHSLRVLKTAYISYAHTTWVSYLVGERWMVLQSVVHWSQMDHRDTNPPESDEDVQQTKRWKSPVLDTYPLTSPPLVTEGTVRPRKRRRTS
jgi:hypothetical protein